MSPHIDCVETREIADRLQVTQGALLSVLQCATDFSYKNVLSVITKLEGKKEESPRKLQLAHQEKLR